MYTNGNLHSCYWGLFSPARVVFIISAVWLQDYKSFFKRLPISWYSTVILDYLLHSVLLKTHHWLWNDLPSPMQCSLCNMPCWKTKIKLKLKRRRNKTTQVIIFYTKLTSFSLSSWKSLSKFTQTSHRHHTALLYYTHFINFFFTLK